ncbi:acyl-CoA dehydrogenase/oxidase [Hyaloraphidium curvatum]|nr:acyl-CoA dehydrogenase/oxidase [Hyaloraphidium curvatum]
MGGSYTAGEVARHSSENDGRSDRTVARKRMLMPGRAGPEAWIIVENKVYDVSKFADEHPGGKKILLRFAGKDATEQFRRYHNPQVLSQYGKKLEIGSVDSIISQVAAATKAAPAKAQSALLTGQLEVFGDLAPFAEPYWYQDWYSPYYDESHRALRAHIRQLLQANTFLDRKEEFEALIRADKPLPREIFEVVGKAGFFRVIVGPPWRAPDLPGIPSLPMGIKPENWNMFHEMVVLDELRASPSLMGSFFGGQAFAIPPIEKHGPKWMKEKLLPALYSGTETAALAISEPHAGSDVQNIQTTARLSDDGKHFIVNGEKKWITGGVWADWFTTAVRTGGAGGAGISVLMIPRTQGVKTRHIEVSAGVMGGTAYVTFDDVKVPVENLIGKINEGFKALMTNFNHERILICIGTNRSSRICYQEALHYAHKRKTFGKFLIEHGVIRDKFAQMARQIEATHAWIEVLAYQMTKMDPKIQDLRLGGAIALCKLQCTRVLELCAREASQILGGIAYTKGGQGGRVEAIYRSTRGAAIPGGSEEIMADLGVRMSTKVGKLLGADL